MLDILALQPGDSDTLRLDDWLGRARQRKGRMKCAPAADETTLAYGSCQVGGCPCGKYKGTGWDCLSAGCGHKFADHN